MKFIRSIKFIDWLLIASSVATCISLVEVSQFIWEKKLVPSLASGWWWLFLFLVLHIFLLAIIFRNRVKEDFIDEPGFIQVISKIPQFVSYGFLAVIPLVYPVLRLFFGNYYFNDPTLRLYVFVHAALIFFLIQMLVVIVFGFVGRRGGEKYVPPPPNPWER